MIFEGVVFNFPSLIYLGHVCELCMFSEGFFMLGCVSYR